MLPNFANIGCQVESLENSLFSIEMRCFESDNELLSIDERRRSEEGSEDFIPDIYV